MSRVQRIGQFKRSLLYTAIATAMVGGASLSAYAGIILEDSEKPAFEGVVINPIATGAQHRGATANEFGTATYAKSIEIKGYRNLVDDLGSLLPQGFNVPNNGQSGIEFAITSAVAARGLYFHGSSLRLSDGASACAQAQAQYFMADVSAGGDGTEFKPKGDLFLSNFKLTADVLGQAGVAAQPAEEGREATQAVAGSFLNWLVVDSDSELNIVTGGAGVNAANISVMGKVVGADVQGAVDGSSVVFHAPESVYKRTNGDLAHLHMDGNFYPLPANGRFNAAQPGNVIPANDIAAVAIRLFEIGGDKDVKVQFAHTAGVSSRHYDKLRVLAGSKNNTIDLTVANNGGNAADPQNVQISTVENYGEITGLVDAWPERERGQGQPVGLQAGAAVRAHRVVLRQGGATQAKYVVGQVGPNSGDHASLYNYVLVGEMEGEGNAAAPNVGILDIDKGHTAHLNIRSEDDFYSQAYVVANNNKPTPNQVMVAGNLQGLITGNNQLVLDGGNFQGFVVSSAEITHEFKDKSGIGSGVIDGSATYKGTVTIRPSDIAHGDDAAAMVQPLAPVIDSVILGADDDPTLPSDLRFQHATTMRDTAQGAFLAARAEAAAAAQAQQNHHVGAGPVRQCGVNDQADQELVAISNAARAKEEQARAVFDAANAAHAAEERRAAGRSQAWVAGTTQLSGGQHVVEGNLVLRATGENNLRVVGQGTTLDLTKEGSKLSVSIEDIENAVLVVGGGATLALSPNGTPLCVSGNELSEAVMMASNVANNAIPNNRIRLVSCVNGGTVTGRFQEKTDIHFLYHLVIDTSVHGEIHGKIEEERNVSGAIGKYIGKSGVVTDVLAKRLESVKTPVAGEKRVVLNEALAEARRGIARANNAAEDAPVYVEYKQMLNAVEAAKDKGPQALARLADETLPQTLFNGANVRLSRNVVGEAHSNIVHRLNGSMTGASAIAAGDEFESQGVWGHYINVNGKQNSKDNIAGFDSKYNGITVGWDAGLNDGITSGFAFTYVKADIDTKDVGQSTKGDHYMGTFYVGWNDGPWVANGMLSYAQGENDYKSHIANVGEYKGDGKTKTWALTFGAGYNLPLDDEWMLQPKAEFNYVNVKVDDYDLTNSNMAFNTKVSTDNFDVIELGVGLRVVGDIEMGEGRLMPEFRLMGYYDFQDKSYQGDIAVPTVMHAEGVKRERSRGVSGLGLSYAANENLSVGLDYDYHFQDGYKAHAIMAKISYDF